MSIRWRVGVLLIQLVLLGTFTFVLTGRPVSGATWFTAGLLVLVINPQLLEPWYPRPVDVLANALIAGVLTLTATRSVAVPGWRALGGFLVVAFALSLLAIGLGRKASPGLGARVGHFASILSRAASSRVIYSWVFLLAALEYHPQLDRGFWLLMGLWASVFAIGLVNWQSAFGVLATASSAATGQGMLGPTTLCVAAPTLPDAGSAVRLDGAGASQEGLVLQRIVRESDVWGQVFIPDARSCEALARASSISITPAGEDSNVILGSVLPGSTDTKLEFAASRPLKTGLVVAAASASEPILYQLRYAEIEQATIRGGSHQVVRAHAAQVGIFKGSAARFERHRWVPSPGGAVSMAPTESDGLAPPAHWLRLGVLNGTQLPVFLDPDLLCEGHLAILGMTRMGKSTVARRLAIELAKTRRVTVLDLTSEWVAKRGLPAYKGSQEDSTTGVSVNEPKVGASTAQFGLQYLQSLVKLAHAEYKVGTPFPRVLIVDEAHQFVPEPAGLGFNSPERDAALQFGQLMMQIRKYRITVVLISQRTAVVAKSALSQCENVIAFKSVDQTGLDYLEAVLGGDARRALPSLGVGQALVGGPALNADLTVEAQMLADAPT